MYLLRIMPTSYYSMHIFHQLRIEEGAGHSSILRPKFIVATFAKEEFFLCKGTISSLAKEYLEISNFKRFSRFPLQRYP